MTKAKQVEKYLFIICPSWLYWYWSFLHFQLLKMDKNSNKQAMFSTEGIKKYTSREKKLHSGKSRSLTVPTGTAQ